MTELPELDLLEDRLRLHVEALASIPRPPGSAAHTLAQASIEAHFRQAGFEIERQPFSVNGSHGVNVLTVPRPAERPDLPLVIIGAHYDSIPDSPGADDNASAVAALMELADVLGPLLDEPGPWHARVQLAAYDHEESGLLGSAAHVNAVRGPIRGMISLEMLGYADRTPGSQRLPPHLIGLYPDVADFIGVVGNDKSKALLAEVVAGFKLVPKLNVEALAVPGCGEELPEARLSDHSTFWDRGLPALMVTDTSFFRNPHYHRPGDLPGTLDYAFLARVAAGVQSAVYRLLRAETI
jgi:Zn-dependent M28 family amino/carboxypeptidase